MTVTRAFARNGPGLVAGGAVRRTRRRRTNVSLLLGLLIVGSVVLMAVFAPLLTSYSPTEQDPADALLPPGGEHWLGTDVLGRDVWAQLLYGARIDLRTAFLAMLFPLVIGSLLGAMAGFFGGFVDTVLNWMVNVVVAFPFYVLMIALAFMLGPGQSSIYIAITLVAWVAYARIVRAEVLVAKQQEYMQAVKVGGLSRRRAILRHLMPNVMIQAIVFSASDLVLDILAIVTLGYLGLGIQPPTPDWGRMIASGQEFITTHWYLATFPGLAVVITGVGLALLADGLADLLRTE